MALVAHVSIGNIFNHVCHGSRGATKTMMVIGREKNESIGLPLSNSIRCFSVHPMAGLGLVQLKLEPPTRSALLGIHPMEMVRSLAFY